MINQDNIIHLLRSFQLPHNISAFSVWPYHSTRFAIHSNKDLDRTEFLLIAFDLLIR